MLPLSVILAGAMGTTAIATAVMGPNVVSGSPHHHHHHQVRRQDTSAYHAPAYATYGEGPHADRARDRGPAADEEPSEAAALPPRAAAAAAAATPPTTTTAATEATATTAERSAMDAAAIGAPPSALGYGRPPYMTATPGFRGADGPTSMRRRPDGRRDRPSDRFDLSDEARAVAVAEDDNEAEAEAEADTDARDAMDAERDGAGDTADDAREWSVPRRGGAGVDRSDRRAGTRLAYKGHGAPAQDYRPPAYRPRGGAHGREGGRGEPAPALPPRINIPRLTALPRALDELTGSPAPASPTAATSPTPSSRGGTLTGGPTPTPTPTPSTGSLTALVTAAEAGVMQLTRRELTGLSPAFAEGLPRHNIKLEPMSMRAPAGPARDDAGSRLKGHRRVRRDLAAVTSRAAHDLARRGTAHTMRTSTTDLLPRRPVAAAGTHASEDPWDVGPLPSRAEKARTSTDHAAAATAAGAGAYFRRHTSRSASLAAGHESRHVGGGDAHHLHPGTHRLQRMSMNGRAGHVSPHPPHADSDHRHGDFSQDAAWNPTVWHDAGSIDDAGTDDTWTNDPWTDGIVRRGATAAPRSSTSPTRYGDNDSERDIGGNDDGDSNGDHDRGRDASDTSATYAIDLPRPVSFGIRHDGAADLALAVERVTEGWDSTADDAAWKAIALDEQDVVESVEVHTFMQPRHRSDHHWRLRSRLAY